MGNKIAMNYVIGTGQKKFNREWAGPGIVMIHKYTFYINKL